MARRVRMDTTYGYYIEKRIPEETLARAMAQYIRWLNKQLADAYANVPKTVAQERKKSYPVLANPLKSLVPPARLELATQGLGIKERLMAISHHFQTLTYQPLPGTMLEYVGFCWVIFGCDGYSLVTVLVGHLT